MAIRSMIFLQTSSSFSSILGIPLLISQTRPQLGQHRLPSVTCLFSRRRCNCQSAFSSSSMFSSKVSGSSIPQSNCKNTQMLVSMSRQSKQMYDLLTVLTVYLRAFQSTFSTNLAIKGRVHGMAESSSKSFQVLTISQRGKLTTPAAWQTRLLQTSRFQVSNLISISRFIYYFLFQSI